MALSPAEKSELSKLHQLAQAAWLLEIEVPTDPVSRYRLTNAPHAITFGTDSSGVGQVYTPFAFEVDGIRADGQGGAYTMTVKAKNVRRELMAAIEHYDGLIEQPARLMLVHRALLAAVDPLLRFDGRISTNVASARDIEITIGHEGMYRVPIPLLRTSRDFCNHVYGGVECGYDTTLSGAMQTCTFEVEGDFGCRAHGVDEEAAGQENRHPLRFGGQLGVPRRAGARLG